MQKSVVIMQKSVVTVWGYTAAAQGSRTPFSSADRREHGCVALYIYDHTSPPSICGGPTGQYAKGWCRENLQEAKGQPYTRSGTVVSTGQRWRSPAMMFPLSLTTSPAKSNACWCCTQSRHNDLSIPSHSKPQGTTRKSRGG